MTDKNTRIDLVPTLDEGYAIIYANFTNITSALPNPLEPQGGIYTVFLDYGKITERDPVVFWQTTIPGLEFTGFYCDIAYVGVGQTCVLTISPRNTSGISRDFFIKVDFLTSGSVYNLSNFQISETFNLTNYRISSLRYGGYLLSATEPIDGDSQNLYGYIVDNDGTFIPWNLTNPTVAGVRNDFCVLPNNTVVIPQPEVGQTWNLITSNLTRLKEERGTRKNSMIFILFFFF